MNFREIAFRRGPPLHDPARLLPEYAAGVSATGDTLGILIPPSNPMLVYGIIALFTAGFVPGALVGACLMATAYVIARRHGYQGTIHAYTLAEFDRTLLKNIWSLMAPVVILSAETARRLLKKRAHPPTARIPTAPRPFLWRARASTFCADTAAFAPPRLGGRGSRK